MKQETDLGWRVSYRCFRQRVDYRNVRAIRALIGNKLTRSSYRSLHFRKIVENEHYVFLSRPLPSSPSPLAPRPSPLPPPSALPSPVSGTWKLTINAGIPPGMVSLRFGDHWRPLPRAIGLPALHRYHFGPPLHPGGPVVHAHGSPRCLCAKVRGLHRPASHHLLRWLGLHHVDGRPRLARHLHDLVPRPDPALDPGLCCPVPAQPRGHQIPQGPCRPLLRHPRAVDLLFHSA